MPEDAVLKRYRLTLQVILDLIAELRDELDPSVNLGTAIPAHMKVLCSLHFLVSGSFQHSWNVWRDSPIHLFQC